MVHFRNTVLLKRGCLDGHLFFCEKCGIQKNTGSNDWLACALKGHHDSKIHDSQKEFSAGIIESICRIGYRMNKKNTDLCWKNELLWKSTIYMYYIIINCIIIIIINYFVFFLLTNKQKFYNHIYHIESNRKLPILILKKKSCVEGQCLLFAVLLNSYVYFQ